MMKIYLCEDSASQLTAWDTLLKKYIFINHLNAEVLCKATAPEELLASLADARTYLGLYYLDVELRQPTDGFALAQRIRRLDPRAHIVFISVHKDLCLEPYHQKIEALDYIWKGTPDEEPQMLRCLDIALENYNRFTNPLLKNELILKNHGDFQYLKSADIIFLEAMGKSHKINIHMENGSIQQRGSLNDIFAQLDSNVFFRCHHSFIINHAFVEEVLLKEHLILLVTGDRIPYSVRKQAGLLDWLKKNK